MWPVHRASPADFRQVEADVRAGSCSSFPGEIPDEASAWSEAVPEISINKLGLGRLESLLVVYLCHLLT